MSQFIEREDYLIYIRDARLKQMIDETPSILDDAEDTAIAIVNDALYSRYDMNTIWAKTGDERPKQVVRWVLNLAIYFLHERLPDRLVPDRVIKMYDETQLHLRDMEDGKKSTSLQLIEDSVNESGHIKTKFRWGSRDARSH